MAGRWEVTRNFVTSRAMGLIGGSQGASQGSFLKRVQAGKEMDRGERNGAPSSPGIGQRAAALSLIVLLVQACASGDVATVADLVTEKNLDPYASDGSGRTPLGAACEGGHIDVVKFLLERDREKRAARGIIGTTPLHMAARGGNVEVVKYFIDEQGMDPSCEDENGFTPYDCAQNNRMRKFILGRGGRESGLQSGEPSSDPFAGQPVSSSYDPLPLPPAHTEVLVDVYLKFKYVSMGIADPYCFCWQPQGILWS